MKKYVLYVNDLCVENIIDVADTEADIKEAHKTAKIFRRMANQNDPINMALVELSEEELNIINGGQNG